jgi:hypothetical protein
VHSARGAGKHFDGRFMRIAAAFNAMALELLIKTLPTVSRTLVALNGAKP